MASTTPRYLYRAYSDQSDGWNSSNYLASQFSLRDFRGSTIKLHGLNFDGTLRDNQKMPKIPASEITENQIPAQPLMLSPKRQLIRALQRNPVADNAFIFFTSSFPQVLMHAIYKNRKETNVRITCLDTTTARTSKGHAVAFYPIRDIRQSMEITVTEGHCFEELDFDDVYLTTDTVTPGEGSAAVSLKKLLDSGLCKCVPEIGVIKSTGSAGVAAPIRNLREFWFNPEYKKTIILLDNHFNLAAKLAATFKPTSTNGPVGEVPIHTFAWFVAMMDPDGDNHKSLEWIHKHGSFTTIDSEALAEPTEQDSWLKEVNAFNLIMDQFSDWSIKINDIKNLKSDLPAGEVTAAAEEFKVARTAINKKRKDDIEARKSERVAKSNEKKRKRGTAQNESNVGDASVEEAHRATNAMENDQSGAQADDTTESVS